MADQPPDTVEPPTTVETPSDELTTESVQTLLDNLKQLHPVYLYNLPNIASYESEGNTLAIEAEGINRKLQEFDRIEDTYDREFIDRKKNPTQFGLISNTGLLTTQDWILAFFFISYAIFTVLLFITIIINAEKKLKAAVFVFCVTGVLGILITSMILRYA